jgi:FkbM family methyltransferase
MRNCFQILESLGMPSVRGILQVGASTGQEIPLFLQYGVQFAALIEPLDGPFAVLRERCAGLPGYLPMQVLCGSRDGEEVDFHVSSNNGESSSILPPARHLADYPWVQFPATIRLQSFTLDRIFATVAAHQPEIAQAVDLLFMDVQGAELEVLKGANAVLHQVNAIYTEVGMGGGYEGDVELTDLMHYLRAYGFRLYELEFGYTGWGNAMFVKRPPGANA